MIFLGVMFQVSGKVETERRCPEIQEPYISYCVILLLCSLCGL